MAIMTGVHSAQVLGPTTQKQADRSRAELNGGNSGSTGWDVPTDGGRDENVERENGLDVIR